MTITRTLKNTSPQVKDLLKNTDLINKFKGVFFMPNFINFTNDLITGDTTTPFADMLYLKMDATGIPLNISLP